MAVPVSKLAELVQLTKDHLDELGIVAAPIFGHVGDGSFHVLPMFDSSEPEQVDKVRELEATMTRRAIEMGGTCTGEHGIGTGKSKYLEDEFGGSTLDMMRVIKQAVDPKHIMNPGKILPKAYA